LVAVEVVVDLAFFQAPRLDPVLVEMVALPVFLLATMA
jgi:hypothetical protein